MRFINWMDSRSRLVKILFCLPIVDIIWGLYRIVGCFTGRFKFFRLLLAILWLIWAGVIGWILDLIFILVCNHICWFKD